MSPLSHLSLPACQLHSCGGRPTRRRQGCGQHPGDAALGGRAQGCGWGGVPAAVVARVVHAVVAGRVEHQLQRPPQAAHQLGVGKELEEGVGVGGGAEEGWESGCRGAGGGRGRCGYVRASTSRAQDCLQERGGRQGTARHAPSRSSSAPRPPTAAAQRQPLPAPLPCLVHSVEAAVQGVGARRAEEGQGQEEEPGELHGGRAGQGRAGRACRRAQVRDVGCVHGREAGSQTRGPSHVPSPQQQIRVARGSRPGVRPLP